MPGKTDLEYWKDRTRRFGEASIGYGCNERLIRWDNVLRERAISRLVTIRPGLHVLDVGTASGYWAVKYARAGAVVTGLDFNEDILRVAREKARAAGVDVTWISSPLEEANLPGGHFDLVLSVTCLQHITDRERQEAAVACILRALKPGGVFVLLEDTVRDDGRVNEYMRSHSQRGWIDLVESQGAHLVDFTGVSFVRFKLRRVPAAVQARIDAALGKMDRFRARATVTAFAFGRQHG
jgi:ubiquinone/menaquinone biosynthesis C-methylase UbiE